MQVLRAIPARAAQPSVLTIGNFDGVHRGHQTLLARLVETARACNARATVLTFEPHPREYFVPDNPPARLSGLRDKLALLAQHEVDRVYVCRFDARLAAIAPRAFIDDILVRGLAARHIIVGDDFRFGAGRAGDFALLRAAGMEHGFSVASMPTLEEGAQRVSSSAVRTALAQGNLTLAARLLGRPYCMSGRVVRGQQLGRTLGFPTANLRVRHRHPPLRGVFAVAVEGLHGTLLPGVANLGSRPTVSGRTTTNLEVHLLDWNGDCYGRHLRVHFLARQRDETRYATLEALTEQIARDVENAREWFVRHPLQD